MSTEARWVGDMLVDAQGNSTSDRHLCADVRGRGRGHRLKTPHGLPMTGEYVNFGDIARRLRDRAWEQVERAGFLGEEGGER
jgi:hypothetical protein